MAVAPGSAAASASADLAEASATAAAASAALAGLTVDEVAASAAAAAASAAAALVSETNAETAETNAETAQTAAELAETNAETAASTATTQAGIATTQAGIATTQAGLASTAATNAQTAETNAETAEANAETAETNAEAAQVAAEAARDAALSTYANLDGGLTNQVLVKNSDTDFDFAWETFSSMSAAVYDPQNIADDAFDTDNHTDGSTNGVYTLAERSKLSGIEAAADVTDATNVAAAGAVMDGDFSADGIMVRTGAGAYASRTIDVGNGLTGSNLDGDAGNPSLAVGAGTGILSNANDVAVDKATDANVRAAASNKVITTDLIETASAGVALTDAATVAVDWDAGIFFTLTITANRILGNPTNGQPGTFRIVHVQASTTTDRTLTFGNQYLNVLPTLTDIDSAQEYLLTIFCLTTTHFIVTATKATNF